MKTSVMEVRDMLSVLSVQGVEERIGEVPGVESATVNYAAGNATVRYDETRLEIADIRSAVRQSGYESDAPNGAATDIGHKDHAEAGAPSAPAPAGPKTPSGASAPAGAPPPDKAAADVAPSSALKPSPGVSAAAPVAKPPAAPKSTSDAAPEGDTAAPVKS